MKQHKRIGQRIGAFMLTLILGVGLLIPTASAAGGIDRVADATPVRVTLDGREILTGEAVIIRSTTYVPLRSLSELWGADSITWNGATSTATGKKGNLTVSMTDGGPVVPAAERYFYTEQPILNRGGRLFVPVRALAKAFSMEVDWDHATRTAVLRSTGKTLVSGVRFYNADDVYWLARIIYAEAGGESLRGQIAVGNVVLNRVAHPQYPNTIYGVIFDRKGGVQFTPVALGTIYRTPSAASIVAAKICLEGTTLSDEILFFMNPRLSTSNWISKNRPFAFTIGNHDFYK